ncbi:MAG: hypothetical protein J5684_06550 [Eubacterium sp.]|nr:hypothetical protein [Eubacterium sp.]
MKKYNKKFFKNAFFLMAVLFMMSLTGCGSRYRTIKNEGMEITLSKDYQKATLANATWYYTSPDGIAMGVRSSKEDIEKSGLEANSAQDYAEAYIRANNIPGSPKVNSKDDYLYFEYNRKVSGTDYSYLTCVFDNNDEFWLVNFACYKELYNEYKNDFFESADSVVFK